MAKSILEDNYYTSKELADTLKVEVRTIQREIIRGNLEAVKVGRQYRVTQSAFNKYLERNSSGRNKNYAAHSEAETHLTCMNIDSTRVIAFGSSYGWEAEQERKRWSIYDSWKRYFIRF